MKKLITMLGITLCLHGGSFENITPSTPDEIASLHSDLLVENYISAISGQLVISEVDLHVKGAQDILFTRTYVAPQISGRYDNADKKDKLALGRALIQLQTKGWITLPNLLAGYNLHSPYFQVRDSQGSVFEFEIQENRGILRTSSYGCSNLRSGKPNSMADIRNTKLLVEENKVKIIWPDGTQHIYVHQVGGLYRLEIEYLPNGKAIRYQWNRQGLTRIAATDASGKYTYAYLDRINDHHYLASDGREVKLTYAPKAIEGKIKRKKRTEKFRFSFNVMTEANNPAYNHHAYYNERTLLTSYDTLKYPISCSYSQEKHSLARIENFSTPSSTISFTYNPPVAGIRGGSTAVSYPNGTVVVYRFNSCLLLSSLENWFEGKLYNQKIFSYDHKQHISKVETKDGDGNILLTKIYVCDQSGNPILEKEIKDSGTFSIKRSFSKNRLISEERDDGLGIEYTYLKDTHLPLSKTTLMHGNPIRKTLYTYDKANNLIEQKEVGKTITTFHLYQEGPNLHRISYTEQKDWDGNLIHKTGYSYDQFGNISREDHFGSDGKFTYSIKKLYDAKGNLLEETNPLGQKASYTYDIRNRAIQETPFSNRLTIKRKFDDKGRLTHQKEGSHETRFRYNNYDKLIEKTDYLGLTTHYTYHPVHGKPTLIKEDGSCQEITYDPWGREVERKNVYGATIQTKRNSNGDPLEITYPDGGKEYYKYAPNGLLIERVDPDGLITSYSYDPLGRLLSQKDGAYETNFTYDAYHLIEKKNPLGISTYYSYNLAGQKTKEKVADRVTEFSYDSLGFLTSMRKS